MEHPPSARKGPRKQAGPRRDTYPDLVLLGEAAQVGGRVARGGEESLLFPMSYAHLVSAMGEKPKGVGES
jgi:hypothetical protein